MKTKLLLYSFLLAIAGMFVACSSDDDPAGDNNWVQVSTTNLSMANTAGMYSFTVTSSAIPTVREDGQDWYTTTKVNPVITGSGYSTTVNVTVKEHSVNSRAGATRAHVETGTERSATLTILCGDATATVTLTQAAPNPAIVIDYDNKMAIADLPEITGTAADAAAFGLALGLGWNLGNHMEAYNDNGTTVVAEETCWGNSKATAQTFQKVKAAGYSFVRIPVSWLGHIGAGPSYSIEESYMNRVAEIVDYAEAAGLKCIVNIHHDGADSKYWLNIKDAAASETSRATIKAEFTAIWTQIAEKFKNKGHFLIFEPFNEIHDGGWGWGTNREDGGLQYSIVNEWNQAFVDAVRATGGNNTDRYLSVIGYCADIDLTCNNLVIPTDVTPNRLVVGIHSYEPYDYTLGCSYDVFGHNAGKAGESKIVEYLKRLKETYQDKGIPTYVGEFGCSQRNSTYEKYRLYYLEYFCKAARENNIALAVWDNGATGVGSEHHAYIDHGTGEYCSDEAKAAVNAMIDGYYTNDPDYTLDWVYNTSPE